MYCSKCRTENPSDANFCRNCGSKMNQTSILSNEDERMISISENIKKAKASLSRKQASSMLINCKVLIAIFSLLCIGSVITGLLFYSSTYDYYLKYLYCGTEPFYFGEYVVPYGGARTGKDSCIATFGNYGFAGDENGNALISIVAINTNNDLRDYKVTFENIIVYVDNYGDIMDTEYFVRVDDLNSGDWWIFDKGEIDGVTVEASVTIPTQQLRDNLQNISYALFAISGFAALLIILILIRMKIIKKRIKY